MTRATGNPKGRPRRRWNHYPAKFFQVIEWFSERKDEMRLTVKREELYTYRTQFYRFFGAIRDEYDNRTSDLDAVASKLADAFQIVNNVLLNTDENTATLIFTWGTLADDFRPTSLDSLLELRERLHKHEIEKRQQFNKDNMTKILEGPKKKPKPAEVFPAWVENMDPAEVSMLSTSEQEVFKRWQETKHG